MKILGFDVSSATIGWCLMDTENNTPTIIQYGFIKPIKKDKAEKLGFGMIYRVNDALEKATQLIQELKPDVIVIEDFAKKFTAGRSTAHTIITLAVFNTAVALAGYKYNGVEPKKFAATEMRKHVGKRYGRKITSKDDVFPFIQETFSDFKIINKKTEKPKDEMYDQADAIFTALAYAIITKEI